jgi:MoaA/NifB/PqqE/SkfB family radical SAM enzyme
MTAPQKRPAVGLGLSAGRACFTRCKGCYNHFGKRELTSTATILRFLEYARSRGLSEVTLCGGDPLSRADILELCEGIRPLSLYVKLDTVGTPLLGASETIFQGRGHVEAIDAARLAELVDLIGIPLEGPDDASISAFRMGRPGLFEEQMRILDILDSVGARVCINTVVYRQNVDTVADLFPILERHPAVVKWQVFQYSPTGPSGHRHLDTHAIDDAVFEELATLLRQRRACFSGELSIKSNARRKRAHVLVDSDGVAWRPAGKEREVLGSIARRDDFERIVDVLLIPEDDVVAERKRRCHPDAPARPRYTLPVLLPTTTADRMSVPLFE